ncbi:gephyrin-like molybdotransferase Glp [Chloroflexota bacterium]
MIAQKTQMISVEEALDKVLSYVGVLEQEDKPILDCLGQVMAEEVYASLDVPPADSSAMDGFAVQVASISGTSRESPAVLCVIGEVAAGYTSDVIVGPGQAVRIMTGAPVPQGADAVVPFEYTDETERRNSLTQGQCLSEIAVMQEVSRSANIRTAGEDVTRGSLVLEKDTLIRPAEIGVLASIGRSTARVIRRPVIAVLSTGDEVVDISQPLPPGKIYNSNSYAIAAQVKRYGGIPRVLDVAPDSDEPLTNAIYQGLDSDLLITTGGVSKGDYDMVKDVLAREGEIGFWTVRMKPGKPLAFGAFRSGNRIVPHLGLPGYPVSSMVTFEVFARPAILKMLGKKDFSRPVVEASFIGYLKNTDGRRVFARVRVDRENGEYVARLSGRQGSGVLTSLARANGLAIVPESVSEVKDGEWLKVIMLNWNEDNG